MYTVEEFDKEKTKVFKYIMYKKRTEYEIRNKFKNEKRKIMVVYSEEEGVKVEDRVPGSTSLVPSVAGIMCASFIINDIKEVK